MNKSTFQKALAEKLKLVKDEDLKCELVKTDLQENPCLESSKIVRHLLANQPNQVEIVHAMEYFRLRFILRCANFPPLGRECLIAFCYIFDSDVFAML